MTTGYRQRIDERVARLRATPGFSVRAYEVAPPVTDAELASATELAQGRLPAGVAEFYSELNGFRLEWEYAAPDTGRAAPTDFGSINVVPLGQVFADGLGDTWYDDFEGGDRFRAVKPFDVHMPEACVAFLQEPGRAPGDDVHFHYFGESLKALDLGFPRYLEGALASCGYVDWRMALTPDDPRLPEGRPTLERMRAIIPGFEGLPRPGPA